MEQVFLGKELKIQNVKREWIKVLGLLTNERSNDDPLHINLSEVEKADGAGVQLLLYLMSLSQETPQKCIVEGTSDKILKLLGTIGFDFTQQEVNK